MLVVTLPIGLRMGASFATLLSPLVGRTLARYYKGSFWLALNLTGSRYENLTSQEIKHQKEAYLQHLRDLCEEPALKVWNDREADFQPFLQEIVTQYLNTQVLVPRRTTMLRCDCGRVELPLASLNEEALPKLVEKTNASFTCRLCKSSVRQSKYLALSFCPTQSAVPALKSYPRWTRSRLDGQLSFLTGLDLVVSRQRETAWSIHHQGTSYYLDTDFAWSHFLLQIIQKTDEQEGVSIVTSPRTMLKAVQVARITRLLCPLPINLVIHPLLRVHSKHTSLTQETSIKEFMHLAAPEYLRWFLLGGLQWQEEAGLDSSILYQAQHSVRPYLVNLSSTGALAPSTDLSIPDFLEVMNGHAVTSTMTCLRKRRPLTSAQVQLCRLC